MKREAGRESVQDKYSISINPPVERQPPSQFLYEKNFELHCDAALLRDRLTDWRYQEQLNYEQNEDIITETVIDTLTTVIKMIENSQFPMGTWVRKEKGGTDGSQNDKFAR